MLLHCLYLFEFKFVFEINFVSSFENSKKFSFPSLPFSSFWPTSSLQPACLDPIQPRSPAHRGPACLRSPPPPCPADVWVPVVITDLWPHPIRTGSDLKPTAPHSLLWARTPRRPPLGLFSHHHCSSLGLLLLPAIPKPPPPTSIS
jgi:hypothetical protein